MGSPVDNRNVQEIALNNPIILTQILKQSSTLLKTARLVCPFWNDVVLSVPNTELIFNLRHPDKLIESDAVPFFEICSTLDERVAKRISAAFPESPFAAIFSAKVMHSCDKFSGIIQILEVFIQHETCFASVYHVLRRSCQNLRQLKVSCTFAKQNLMPIEEQKGMLKVRPNLTKFSLSSNLVTAFLAKFIEAVINTAPNLRDLTLPWGYYPNFSNSSKSLQSLTIAQDSIKPIDMVSALVALPNIARILDKVSESLVTLSFRNVENSEIMIRDGMEGIYNFERFLPTGFLLAGGKMMKKLKNLRIEMVDIFRSVDLLRNIGEMLPALETVAIGRVYKRSKCAEEILRNICNQGKTLISVKHLELIEVHDPTLLDGLKTVFPNLERLKGLKH
ncbi:uncharacterized protein LOC118437095 isoform X2 [Folsomia candida]|uniref:uncharacterized protein LOC118437095 isoform X2 n=1 Tax=Folsomia candida TaxID=158441 RepID=UPI001604CC11|nr:uncharacterized protein LOC118437095 isoform X2 [Folsomia candida]